MRTYNRKVGFFNKDSAANIQRVNRQAIETRQQISQAIKELIGTASNQSNLFSQPLPKGMSYSPVAVLAGNAKPYLNGRSTLTNVYNDLGYDRLGQYDRM